MTHLDTIEPIERRTLGDRIHAELCDLLMSGRLAPGERLSLRSLAERLGVSVMPVRDAVGRLANDDVLSVLPGRAVHVPPMTADRLQELTTVRVVVEGFAAARAASLRSEAEVAALRDHEAAFARQVAAPVRDVVAALRANMDLHFAVYAAARLPTLEAVIRQLWMKIGPALNLDLGAASDRLSDSAALRHHAALVAAITARKPEAARAALTADIESAARFIRSRLPA